MKVLNLFYSRVPINQATPRFHGAAWRDYSKREMPRICFLIPFNYVFGIIYILWISAKIGFVVPIHKLHRFYERHTNGKR